MDCKYCHKTFPTQTRLNRHYNKKLPCCKEFRCIRCQKVFPNKSSFDTHFNRKTPCDIIVVEVKVEARAEKVEVEKEALESKEKCAYCNRTYANKSSLNRHLTKCLVKKGGLETLAKETSRRIQALKNNLLQLQEKNQQLQAENTILRKRLNIGTREIIDITPIINMEDDNAAERNVIKKPKIYNFMNSKKSRKNMVSAITESNKLLICSMVGNKKLKNAIKLILELLHKNLSKGRNIYYSKEHKSYMTYQGDDAGWVKTELSEIIDMIQQEIVASITISANGEKIDYEQGKKILEMTRNTLELSTFRIKFGETVDKELRLFDPQS